MLWLAGRAGVKGLAMLMIWMVHNVTAGLAGMTRGHGAHGLQTGQRLAGNAELPY